MGGALIVGLERKKDAAMVLASCVNSRTEKRQRRWLVRLPDYRKDGDRWSLSCGGRSRERSGAQCRGEREWLAVEEEEEHRTHGGKMGTSSS